jgi:hypothetical protein
MILFLTTLVLIQFLTVFGQDTPGGQRKRDPVADLCRRFGHATTVIDDKLFIDGGLVSWKNSGPGWSRNSSSMYEYPTSINTAVLIYIRSQFALQ